MKNNREQLVKLHSPDSQFIVGYGWCWIQRGTLDGSYLLYKSEEWETEPLKGESREEFERDRLGQQ